VESACEALICEDRSTEPDAEKAEIYKNYHQLYKKLYEDLKGSYKILAGL
jgi:xylulokinase